LFLTIVFALIILFLAVPILFLFTEVVAAVIPGSDEENSSSNEPRPSAAVLIPAHNEEKGIGETLAAIKEQISAGDRIIVVADNCDDKTAEIARSTKVEVLLRQNSEKKGKGYALDFGLRFLEKNPPNIVAIFDADISISPGTLCRLLKEVHISKRPVQAKNILNPSADCGSRERISAFAFLFKNYIRPLGLSRLGGVCLLTGTGMACPWEIIKDAPLAGSNIVEDMQLGIDMAVAGAPPVFCPAALVKSDLAPDNKAARVQRIRWEHGHLITLYKQTVRLFRQAIIQRRLDLALLGLEVAVPPLSSLVFLLNCSFIVALFFFFAGFIPVNIIAWFIALIIILSISIIMAWWLFGRATIPFRYLFTVPLYIFWKIPIYIKFLLNPQKEWVRTEREDGTYKRTKIE
jgi:cellulose synthase/poly-beta-1,6-N-acetylglucosamine synthase-like glycosyltransferase